MARRRTGAVHIKRIQRHHKRHKKKLLTQFHRVRTHPSCYKPGYKPFKGKAPKSLPRQPKGLNKRGAGLWSSIKKGWHWLTGHVKKHTKDIRAEVAKHAKEVGKELLDEGKKRATAYGKAALNKTAAWGKRQGAALAAKGRAHAEHYIKKADDKINSIASKVDSTVSRYTGEGTMPGTTLKKGSGYVMTRFKRGSGCGCRR